MSTIQASRRCPHFDNIRPHHDRRYLPRGKSRPHGVSDESQQSADLLNTDARVMYGFVLISRCWF